MTARTGPFPAELAGRRDLAYITPSGRRLTEYEAVTCHTQPSPHGGGFQIAGDFQTRPDGRAPFDCGATLVKLDDWYAFRDPNQQWQRPYYVHQSEAEKAIERATEVAAATGAFAALEPDWISEGLLGGYFPYAHVEHGLFRALNFAARESLSDTVNNVLVFNAADKLRHAQAIAILGVDLEEAVAGFDAAAGRACWLEEPAWQPLRHLVEDIMANRDWAEVVVAVNLALEPLLGEPLRRHCFTLAASARRDVVTPAIVSTAMGDWQRNARWSEAFVAFAAAGAGNAEILAGWRAAWGERVRVVAGALLEHLEERLCETGLAKQAADTGEAEFARVGAPLTDRPA